MILFYKEMVVVLLNKKFKFIVIFGTLQVGIRAQLEWIKHISVCFDLKFEALKVFRKDFYNLKIINKWKCFENRKSKTQCVQSAEAKSSELFVLFIAF